jgi:hypothetical protein
VLLSLSLFVNDAAFGSGGALSSGARAASGVPPAPHQPDSGSARGHVPNAGAPADRTSIEERWTSAQQRCNRHPVAAVRKQCLIEARREYERALARLG